MPDSDHLAAFFLPGLGHQFGNLLLAIQGQALVLDGDGLERGRSTILAAVERGGNALRVLRCLSGDHLIEALPAAGLIGDLVTIARVPVRERGFEVVGAVDASVGAATVAAGEFVRAAARALLAVLARVPQGTAGTLVWRLAAVADGATSISWRFSPQPGTLPFPMAVDDMATGLAREMHGSPGLRVAAIEQGVMVTVAGRAVAAMPAGAVAAVPAAVRDQDRDDAAQEA